ncbi:hypothetical protein ACIQPT_12470 [Streptomyces sp. NPDC091289]|uniref:hypothetical protein n=1 Tax=Streptomyces sp. NPDC091289 TaxID=3365989 RepID=UPI00380CD3AF
MVVVAMVLRWIFLVAGVGILAAFLVTAVRARRAGTGIGELVDVLEKEWFATNRVFLAVLAGLAGSWAAGWAGGTRGAVTESVPTLAPLGIVAAFVVCRVCRRTGGSEDGTEDEYGNGDGDGDGGPFRMKLLALVAAPLLLGGVMTGW